MQNSNERTNTKGCSFPCDPDNFSLTVGQFCGCLIALWYIVHYTLTGLIVHDPETATSASRVKNWYPSSQKILKTRTLTTAVSSYEDIFHQFYKLLLLV